MNELKTQSISQMANVFSSSPQVPVSKLKAEVNANAVSNGQESGKTMPPKAQNTAEARSVEITDAVSKLNEYVQKTQRDLDFQLDEDSGKTIISVYDRHSEQLVRQIPNEVALEMAKKLNSEEPPMLFNAQI